MTRTLWGFRVTLRVGMPSYKKSNTIQSRFKKKIIDPFVNSYKNGITPIPCIACNNIIKFGDLYKIVRLMNAKLATGHYAGIVKYKGYKTLSRPFDLSKDQTYYLYGINSEVINNLCLPLSCFSKSFVRFAAERANIKTSLKPDSQEICFIPKGHYSSFIEKSTKNIFSGNFINVYGNKIASHQGIHKYTIGQRRGLGFSTGERAYVIDIDKKTKNITFGSKQDLLCGKIKVNNVNSIIPQHLWPSCITVQIRAMGKSHLARYNFLNNEIFIYFIKKVSAIAIGQAAVFYDKNILLGGGVIAGRLDGVCPRF